MININDIKEMIKTVDQSSIETFKFEYEGMKMVMEKTSTHRHHSQQVERVQAPEKIDSAPIVTEEEVKPADSATKQRESDVHQVLAPMVGTFYSSSNPDVEPFVKIGTNVRENQVVCILEAMKLFNEIEAEVSGEIVEILVEDGELVEYGQPLFVINVNPHK